MDLSLPTKNTAISTVKPPLPRPTLIIAQYYWPELIGSAPYCTEAAEWFAEKGAEVHVLSARPNYPINKIFSAYTKGSRDRELVSGCSINRVPVWRRTYPGAKARILSEFSFLCGGLSLLLRQQIPRHEHVLAFCPSMLSILIGKIAKKRGGRLVGVVHDIQSGLAESLGFGSHALVRGMRFIERKLFNQCDALIVLSEAMRRELSDIGVTRPIFVLPIWTDIKRIKPLPRSDCKFPTVLYSGNFGCKQGIDQVLSMAPLLRAKIPEVRIVLRGDGSEKRRLEKASKEKELDYVYFEPLVPREEFPISLSDGDVHLVPQEPSGSRFAVPSKAYSILAAGRPFVCTAEPGSSLSDLARETQAFECVPSGDPAGFAEAVSEILLNRPLQEEMGRRGRQWVEENASLEAVLSQYAALVWG